jgi:sphingosine-1-phosphate phosphatase 1
MKDILRLPRPAMPPVIQLESKWALEYGMPSTHAMVGLSVPLSILVFTYGRYQVKNKTKQTE